MLRTRPRDTGRGCLFPPYYNLPHPPFRARAQCLTGIQEENIWLGSCDYTIGHHDTDPAQYYWKLSKGCKLSNGLGVVILLACLFVSYACTDLVIGRGSNTEVGRRGERRGVPRR